MEANSLRVEARIPPTIEHKTSKEQIKHQPRHTKISKDGRFLRGRPGEAAEGTNLAASVLHGPCFLSRGALLVFLFPPFLSPPVFKVPSLPLGYMLLPLFLLLSGEGPKD